MTQTRNLNVPSDISPGSGSTVIDAPLPDNRRRVHDSDLSTDNRYVVQHQGYGRWKRGDVVSYEEIGGPLLEQRQTNVSRALELSAVRVAFASEWGQTHVDMKNESRDASYAQQLAEKDAVIARKDGRIRELEGEAGAQRVTALRQDLQNTATLLGTKDKQIMDQQGLLADKDRQIQSLQERLAAAEQKLNVGVDPTVAELQAQLAAGVGSAGVTQQPAKHPGRGPKPS